VPARRALSRCVQTCVLVDVRNTFDHIPFNSHHDGGLSMRGSVLIVHDDLGVRRCLGEFLSSKGWKALTAASGQEALGILEEDLPKLLVIGVGMPLMSGWKLIEALAHYPDLARIPRLVVNPGDDEAFMCRRALAILERPEGEHDGDVTPAPNGAVRRAANA
jgi:CheY-like chemotaxis protein